MLKYTIPNTLRLSYANFQQKVVGPIMFYRTFEKNSGLDLLWITLKARRKTFFSIHTDSDLHSASLFSEQWTVCLSNGRAKGQQSFPGWLTADIYWTNVVFMTAQQKEVSPSAAEVERKVRTTKITVTQGIGSIITDTGKKFLNRLNCFLWR